LSPRPERSVEEDGGFVDTEESRSPNYRWSMEISTSNRIVIPLG
jgi:hypothetical protein